MRTKYLHKLTKEDFESFDARIMTREEGHMFSSNSKYSKFGTFEDDHITFLLKNDLNGNYKTITFTDYSAEIDDDQEKNEELTLLWQKYLTRKFGANYYYDSKNYRIQEQSKLVIAAAMKIIAAKKGIEEQSRERDLALEEYKKEMDIHQSIRFEKIGDFLQ